MCAAGASLQASRRKKILVSLLASGSGAVIAAGLYAYSYQNKSRKRKGLVGSDGLGTERSGQTDASVSKKQGLIKGHEGRKKRKKGSG